MQPPARHRAIREVQIQRQGDPRELKCTPPDTKLPMACECIESGPSKKKLSLQTALPVDLDGADRLARDNCGGERSRRGSAPTARSAAEADPLVVVTGTRVETDANTLE